jgi:hypothetical protein
MKLLYRWRAEHYKAGKAAFPGHGHQVSEVDEFRRRQRDRPGCRWSATFEKSPGRIGTTSELTYAFIQQQADADHGQRTGAILHLRLRATVFAKSSTSSTDVFLTCASTSTTVTRTLTLPCGIASATAS